MTLVLLLALAFPGARIANLPTGPGLEPGRWQLSISHRFLSAPDNRLLGNALNFLKDANVRLAAERGLPGRFSAGLSYNNYNYELGAGVSWAALDRLTASAGIGTNLVERTLSTTWLNAAVAGHVTPVPRVHLVALPRLTTNTEDLYLSIGLGAKAGLPADFSVGLEAEPVLAGPTPHVGRRLLAWNLALDRELGWHNFTLVLGNAWHQSVPGWFSDANRDVLKGHFRAGFAILRRL
jgi:hypothetical protein